MVKGKVKDLKLKVLTVPGCDGNVRDVILYDPKTKSFLDTWRRFSHGSGVAGLYIDRISVSEMLKKQISGGSNTAEFDVYLHFAEFKKLYNELVRGAKPVFKKGDVVWNNDKYSRGNPIHTFKVGKVVGWKQSSGCNKNTGEPMQLEAIREFTETETGLVNEASEALFKPMSDLEKWEEGKVAVLAARKTMKKSGIVGGTIFYAGKAYKF